MNKMSVAIIGQGYVGLPTSVACAKAGFTTYGIDTSAEKIAMLAKGRSYIDDVSDAELADARAYFHPTTDFNVLKDSDVILICVPTPLNANKTPDTSYIQNAGRQVARHLRKGHLVILESTSYPGTTEEVLMPILEESGLKCGKDFHLAFSPERVDPGNDMAFAEIPRVVGGVTKRCTDLAVQFYKKYIRHVHRVSGTKVAEMAKLLENIYRLVNISLVNELALVAGKMDIDIWEVIEAAKTKPYGFTAFYPSPKVGGHCIPLDPFYLSWKAREYNFFTRFIELAGEINDQMPHFVVTRVQWALNKVKKSVSGARILVVGVAYKKDISDARESAAYDIISDLLRKGAKVSYHDPHVAQYRVGRTGMRSVRLTDENLANADCVLILTDHSAIDFERVASRAKFVVDTRNAVKKRSFKNVTWL